MQCINPKSSCSYRESCIEPSQPTSGCKHSKEIKLETFGDQIEKFAFGSAGRVVQALVHAMIRCMTDDPSAETASRTYRHTAILARFEEYMAENKDRPLYLAEICTAIGVLERTLRRCCQDTWVWGRRVICGSRQFCRGGKANARQRHIHVRQSE
jgi:hypothetical protein